MNQINNDNALIQYMNVGQWMFKGHMKKTR